MLCHVQAQVDQGCESRDQINYNSKFNQIALKHLSVHLSTIKLIRNIYASVIVAI